MDIGSTSAPRMTLARSALWAAALALPMGAAAQPIPTGTGTFQIIPVPPITGTAPTEIYLLALAADGSPMIGLKLKAPKTAGLERRWLEVGDGVYRMPIAPPEVSEPSTLTATAKGKAPDKSPLLTSLGVELLPAAPPFSMEATPPSLVLGQDPDATVQVVGIGASELRTAASVGTMAVSSGETQQVSLRYEPPKLNYPHVAILSVSDATDLSRYGYDTIRLDGAVNFPVKGAPSAQVTLDVSGRSFGPSVLGADGKAKIAIIVPPGVQQATQISNTGGTETRESLDLQIPETRHLSLVPLPLQVPSSGAIPLRAVAMTPSGTPDTAADVRFTVSTGEVGEVKHIGQGIYEASWSPAATPGLSEATVTVSLGAPSTGEAANKQLETVNIGLVHDQPATVSLSAGVPNIGPEAIPFDVTAIVKRSDGASYPGASLSVAPQGATIAGDVVDLGDGSYRFTVVPDPDASGDVTLKVSAAGRSVSRNPVSDLAIFAERARLPNDGTTQVSLQVLARDVFGQPVASAPVAISSSGDGVLAQTQIVTNERGIAETTYTSGASPAVVSFRATAGEQKVLTNLLQLPASAPMPAVRWSTAEETPKIGAPSEASIVIPRGAPVDGAAAPVASIRLTADLPSAVPGATVTITAAPLDVQGALTRASVPEVVATGAIASPPAVGPDGSVKIVLAIPDDASTPIEIRASVGDIVQTISVPVERQDLWASGPVTVAPTPDPLPVPVPRPDPPSGSFPWLRVRASGIGSQYRYEQAPSESPGPLLPKTLAVGRGDSDTPASPLGGELDVRAWGDALGVPYVGLHAQTRLSRYGIQAAAFNGVANDTLPSVSVDLTGRYPIDIAPGRVWLGGTAGFQYTDFLSYRGCLDPGCQVRTEAIPVPGLGFGAELGAELGDLFLVGGYKLGLAGAAQPYANAVDLNVGYGFVDHVFADIGFGLLTRHVLLEGTDSGLARGELFDSQLMIELGVGFSL